MAEVILALGRDDMKGFNELDYNQVNSAFGVKVLTNEAYRIGKNDESRRIEGYPAVSRFARLKGAERVVVDSRIANDTPSEVSDAVHNIVKEVITPPDTKKSKALHKIKKPDFITASVDLSEISMKTFVDNCGQLSVEPIIHLTSSRFTERDFFNRGTTAEKYAESRTKLAINSGFTAGAVICAACDAEVVKNTNNDFFVFATGAILANDVEVEPIEIRHERYALIEETSKFVDVFIIGSPIFQPKASSNALEDRLMAAKS